MTRARGNPISADLKRDYETVRDFFIRAAEKMPEADYGFKWNLWHTWEHYGNVVVYLRLKGLVPPSSEMKMK